MEFFIIAVIVITVSIVAIAIVLIKMKYHLNWLMRMANEEVIGNITRDKVFDYRMSTVYNEVVESTNKLCDLEKQIIHTKEIMDSICIGVDKLYKALPVFDDRLFNALDRMEEKIDALDKEGSK